MASGKLDLDCAKCSKLKPEYRRARGCLGPVQYPLFSFGGVDVFECPMKLMTPDTTRVVMLLAGCKQFGQLPSVGGVIHQTAAFMQAASIVEGTMNEILFPKVETSDASGS